MEQYLAETSLLDFNHASIQALIEKRQWKDLPELERVGAAYAFVKDEILFGYNSSDDLKASAILEDGYGQCNTKTTLLMALLRALDVPCRLHGFTVHKQLQAGIIPAPLFRRAPDEILHSWVEFHGAKGWISLEGFILDGPYLAAVQRLFPEQKGSFCGLGVACDDFEDPPVEFTGEPTYIQKAAISKDFGLFDNPDDFYESHGANFSGARKLLFRSIVRRILNAHVARIRSGDGAAVIKGRLPRLFAQS